MPTATFDDVKINVKLKLAALWTAIMSCYIYGDYFGLYRPGQLQGMLDGVARSDRSARARWSPSSFWLPCRQS